MLIGFGVGAVFLRRYQWVDWKEGGLLGVERESSRGFVSETGRNATVAGNGEKKGGLFELGDQEAYMFPWYTSSEAPM